MDKKVSTTITRLCKRYKVNRSELARLLGVEKRTIYRWESGNTSPPSPKLVLNALRAVEGDLEADNPKRKREA